MARKKPVIRDYDHIKLEFEEEHSVSDGLKLLKEIRSLTHVAEMCLTAESPAYPWWSKDILDKALQLHQLKAIHVILSNAAAKARSKRL